MSAKNYRAAAVAGIAGGIAWAVSGPLQLAGVNEHETKVVTLGEHILISMFSLALILTAAGTLALGRHARDDRGAKVAAAGMVLLALTATTSNINGEDMSFFPIVASLTNLMWLGGSIALAVSLYRTGRISSRIAIALPFAQVFALPLAAVGGGLVAGGYWVAVSYLMFAGALERRSRQVAVPAAA
jgi:hypothetical protein